MLRVKYKIRKLLTGSSICRVLPTVQIEATPRSTHNTTSYQHAINCHHLIDTVHNVNIELITSNSREEKIAERDRVLIQVDERTRGPEVFVLGPNSRWHAPPAARMSAKAPKPRERVASDSHRYRLVTILSNQHNLTPKERPNHLYKLYYYIIHKRLCSDVISLKNGVSLKPSMKTTCVSRMNRYYCIV